MGSNIRGLDNFYEFKNMEQCTTLLVDSMFLTIVLVVLSEDRNRFDLGIICPCNIDV